MKPIQIKSIKGKISLVFSLTFLIMLILLIIINQFFMDDFYKLANKTKMKATAIQFENLLRAEGHQRAVYDIIRTSGMQPFVYDNEFRLLPGYVSNEPWKDFDVSQLEKLKITAQANGDNFDFEVVGDLKYDDSKLVLVKVLTNGNMLLLTKNMGLANEVRLLNFRFMMLTAIFVYVIALMLIIFISSRFSKPIIEIKNKTEKMSRLDFSEKIDICSADELGKLSLSINSLSDKLSSTIKKLNTANEKLNKELQEEKRLEKMRRQFVSDVSHELKNPISMIQGFADGLKHNVPKTDEDKKYYYQVILDESRKMGKLIKDLLELSSYESGSFTLNKENVDLTEIIRNNISKFKYQIDEKKISIELDADSEYLVFGDALRLEQVIINLLTNAIKYVNEDGIIRISLNRLENKVKLTVANSGELIPKEKLKQIWNSFYQIDNRRTGDGLGLAIVKSIVSLHEGSCKAYIEGAFNCFEIII